MTDNREIKQNLFTVVESGFWCKRRLARLSPKLHTCFHNSVFAMDMLLTNYKSVFPFYTDHTFEHSAQVMNFCNLIAGPQIIDLLNADELYVLLMGACLHDVGMGISESDFNAFVENIPGIYDRDNERRELSGSDIIRSFHQELSAEFVRKYKDLFEIPSDEYVHCICQIVRVHRKHDLMNTAEFDPHLRLSNGNVVRLPYITALVKLSDELDIAADRNLLFDYNNLAFDYPVYAQMNFKCHEAIKKLRLEGDALVLYFSTAESDVRCEIMHIIEKIQRVLDEYITVLKERTDFPQNLKRIYCREC